MDLDVLRSSLKYCQHCKEGEKKQFFSAQRKSTPKKSQNEFSPVWQVHVYITLRL